MKEKYKIIKETDAKMAKLITMLNASFNISNNLGLYTMFIEKMHDFTKLTLWLDYWANRGYMYGITIVNKLTSVTPTEKDQLNMIIYEAIQNSNRHEKSNELMIAFFYLNNIEKARLLYRALVFNKKIKEFDNFRELNIFLNDYLKKLDISDNEKIIKQINNKKDEVIANLNHEKQNIPNFKDYPLTNDLEIDNLLQEARELKYLNISNLYKEYRHFLIITIFNYLLPFKVTNITDYTNFKVTKVMANIQKFTSDYELILKFIKLSIEENNNCFQLKIIKTLDKIDKQKYAANIDEVITTFRKHNMDAELIYFLNNINVDNIVDYLTPDKDYLTILNNSAFNLTKIRKLQKRIFLETNLPFKDEITCLKEWLEYLDKLASEDETVSLHQTITILELLNKDINLLNDEVIGQDLDKLALNKLHGEDIIYKKELINYFTQIFENYSLEDIPKFIAKININPV